MKFCAKTTSFVLLTVIFSLTLTDASAGLFRKKKPTNESITARSSGNKPKLFSRIFNKPRYSAAYSATRNTSASHNRTTPQTTRVRHSRTASSDRQSRSVRATPLFSWANRTTTTTARPAAPAPKPAPKPVPSYVTNRSAFSKSTRTNTRVVIDVSKQRGYLLVDNKIAVSTPVSTARPGKYTPRGTFYMSERVRSGKISTIYGVGMPYWMRLSGTVFGVHAGYLPGYPASAGCVRLPNSAAQLIYDNTRSGTRVNIYSSWSGN